MGMGGGDGAGGGSAVILAPTRHHPRRGVENRLVEARKPLGPFAGHSPQHRIDQARVPRRVPVGLREPHREIDGGVIRNIEKENLRRTEEQRGLDARRLRRRSGIEEEADEMAQRAQPAQYACGQRADQRAVALGEPRKRRTRARGFKLVVERAAAAKHAVENVGGNAARGEAWRTVGAAARPSCLIASFH